MKNNQPRILILGAGLFLARSIRTLQRAGFTTIVLDKNPNAEGFRYADFAYPADIVDEAAILKLARRHGAEAILPLNDFAARPAAAVAETLGLRTIGVEAARLATDKAAMRSCWRESGLPQPTFECVNTLIEADRASKEIGFPLIIKPAFSGGGGRGVLIVRDKSELPLAFAHSKRFAQDGELLVEALIDGVEITVEAIADGEKTEILTMSDKRKPPLKARVATDLFYPAAFEEATLKAIRSLAINATRTLGITHGASHTEIIVEPDGGVKLIETAARGGGGHITSDIVSHCSGVDYVESWAKILLGRRVDIRKKREEAAIYHFFCPSHGLLVAIEGIAEAADMEGVCSIGSLKKVGQRVSPLINSMERTGWLVVLAKTRQEALLRYEEVLKRVQFITR